MPDATPDPLGGPNSGLNGGLTGPVVIIGTGLVGASIGCALSAAGYRVHLEDRVPSHAIVAAGRGAGVVTAASPDAVRLVVVATPPAHVASVVDDALDRFPQATVTDVASVKSIIIDSIDAADAHRYVGSHPMAGSQFSGPLTADADLFIDRTWVITPTPANAEADIARVRDLATICGARVVWMDPVEHDQAVAQVSHLPHLMSILTAGHLRGVPSDHLPLAGQGIRDVTRIAGSDPGLWRQILWGNRQAVRAELAGVRADLDELLGVLDDPDALEGFLARGRAGARSLPGKHGLSPDAFVTVTIEIPDAAGALARLFTDVDAAGINVEDLSIEHDPSRQYGYLSVAVDPGSVQALADAMRGKGWELHLP
ncbi:prephenate dehydrogenase [Tessaracoccus sp. SD287]|uniref:prephenate dehydrogenase n=1 Tax=Tessaracoccus sp. SD287 TaxID=2782008 RepID=UPI001A9628D3|nr:prephenate dehydrogenase [Tessaracoccus sp. SD287]MBO1030120.1 prephenate dehydrogenase [Tessaracoccus sp. SD287]